jgi:hypothetical protein
MTTPKGNPSKHYKHVVPDSGFGTYAMLTAMVILP